MRREWRNKPPRPCVALVQAQLHVPDFAHPSNYFSSEPPMRRPALYVLAVLSLAAALVQSSLAEAEKPKPEDVLKRMADYLGKLPAYSTRLSASLDIKAPDGEEQHEFTKMTARVER